MGMSQEFYIRYYVGHKCKFGHEFLEFELRPGGKLGYANNSHYKRDRLIQKEFFVTQTVVKEFLKIVKDSEIFSGEDDLWPAPDKSGRQEIEIVLGENHISFCTTKIGSLLDVNLCNDPEGLKVFYYLAQDIKCLALSLIGLHFRIRPI